MLAGPNEFRIVVEGGRRFVYEAGEELLPGSFGLHSADVSVIQVGIAAPSSDRTVADWQTPLLGVPTPAA